MKKKLFILCIILDIMSIFCLLLAYGPVSSFRNWFVMTASRSWTHGYFARVLYSDDTITQVLNSNRTFEIGTSTDATQIVFDNTDNGVYDSIYEEQILKRDANNDVYKIVNIDTEKSKGYILVIYDPSRISLINSKKMKFGGETISSIAEENKALAAINASGFARNGTTGSLSPDGTVIIDGKLYSSKSGALIGFNNDNILTLTYDDSYTAIQKGMKNAVSFGPFLIVNGVSSTFTGGGGMGTRPRTAVGQRKDGIVLFIVIDGNAYGTTGIDMEELTQIFERYGAYNAANLDGGGSSSLYANGKLINNPTGWGYSAERFLVNAWILK